MKNLFKTLLYAVVTVVAVASCVMFVRVKSDGHHKMKANAETVSATLAQPLRPEQQLLDCTYSLIESLPDSLKQLELTLASTNDTSQPAQVGMQVLAWRDGYFLLTLVAVGDVHEEGLSVAEAFEVYNEFDFKLLRCGI